MTYRRNGEKKGFRIVKRSNYDKEKKEKMERKKCGKPQFFRKVKFNAILHCATVLQIKTRWVSRYLY